MPRLAANLSLLFPEQPFLDRFARARAAGFDAVEFQFPYAFPAAEIADAARAAQVAIVLHNLPPGDWARGERGLACDPARQGDFARSVDLALAYAQTLGVPRLHCMAGLPPPGADREAVRRTYVANLRHAAKQAAGAGIALLIEPLNQFDVPGYFLATPAQAAAIIADVGAPNLKLQCDLYHWQRIQGELAATVRALFPLIGHVQIADNPGRHEPGTGEINYPFLLDLLDELGYDGWVGCEYVPRGDTLAGLAWRDSLSTSKT
ncbi:MAG TPA: hydroxypyruvate isomerase [Telluria sp.]|nr:hydroxypyruvate isomerase [Telluria sp.]